MDHIAEARPPTPPMKKTEKPTAVTPPLSIRDRNRGVSYSRTGFLGEGGFARVYEVIDEDGAIKAVKVVNKASIRTKKNKTKLWAEIKLHQMLVHPNIVRFNDCFEDGENVYMILELCENGSLMDLLRRRKRYTEPEARFYLVQLIGACQYMHATNIIHRDLKLGNLFLDGDMNVKVGDFGLAALIENPGDRKKTICGTPNYIAPEVLFDTANGHSFEVDVWSVGVILYTLLIGKPPFQTKDVKAIYRRIRQNQYEFPADKEISESAIELIMSILNSDPDKRPTLQAILDHRWFLDGPFPAFIPNTANDATPDFRHLSNGQSNRNFESVRRRATGTDPTPSIASSSLARVSALGPSILAQERDFNNAVQPESPISALLSSARQPLVQAPAAIKEPSLLRKLSAAGAQSTLSPARRGSQRTNVAGPSSKMVPLDEVQEEEDEAIHGEYDAEDRGELRRGYSVGVRDREVAAQKARIVSQMAGLKVSLDGRTSTSNSQRKTNPLAPTTTLPQKVRGSSDAPAYVQPLKLKEPRLGLFEIVENNLEKALTMGASFRTPSIEYHPTAPRVFVISWLDYCAKYGMGFAMSDGTVSVHFNDSSSLVLAPGKQYFDHIQPTSGLEVGRRNYAVDVYPSDLNNKVYLLHQFESYMLNRLFGEYDYAYEDKNMTRGMVYIHRYLRMKHVILFRLSNNILQFNFYDHTKLILSSDGLVVSMIDRHYSMFTWSLEALLQSSSDEGRDRKRMESALHKVQYARDILVKIRTHDPNKPKATSEASMPKVTSEVPISTARDRERVVPRPIR